MKETNHITKEQISFHIEKDNSFADIGAHLVTSIKGGNEDNIVWFPQEDYWNLWSFNLVQGIQIGWGKYTSGGFTAGYQYGPDLAA